MNRRWKPVALGTLVCLTTLTIAVAGDLDLNWFTIDGGGDMFCTGGDYELSATIGQPDANTVVMTGGDLELTGGFWPGAGQGVSPNVPSLIDVFDGVDPNDVEPVPPP